MAYRSAINFKATRTEVNQASSGRQLLRPDRLDTENLFRRVQVIQNATARLITGVRRHEHITPVLKQLHWLPVRQRVHFKLAAMVFRALHGTAPYPIWQRTVNSSPPQTAANYDRRPSTRASSPEQVRVSAIVHSPPLVRDFGTACQLIFASLI